MLGAGTVINPIIKIVTTVAILGAVYLFFVKPTLDTTNDVIDRSFGAVEESFDGFDSLPLNIQDQIDEAFGAAGGSASLEGCIQRAIRSSPDAERIQARTDRCIERFAD